MNHSISLHLKIVVPLIFAWGTALFLLLAIPSSAMADGKLRRVKQAVHKQEPKKPKRERHHGSDSHQHESGDEHHDHNPPRRRRGGYSSGFSFFSTTQPCTEIYAAPVVVHQPAYAVQLPPVPAPAVYRSSIVDAIETTSVTCDEAPLLEQPLESSFSNWFEDDHSKLWATIGSDFDGITNGGLGLHLQSPGSLGLDTSVMTLRESSDGYRDHLWFGDFNVVYEVLSRGDIHGRIGAGVNWLSDSWGAEAGFNLTAGVDLRLTERLVLSAEGDVGNLGAADFLHGRVNFSRRLETCDWMLGIDHYNIGGTEINSVFTGIQFRF